MSDTTFHRMQTEGDTVRPLRWQGIDVSKKPEARMVELLNVNTTLILDGCEDLDWYRDDIKPYLPWADDHFDERVGGAPTNPGVTWDKWRHGKSAARFLKDGIFNHNYQERLWPKFAGGATRPTTTLADWRDATPIKWSTMNRGIRGDYGDLMDVVLLLLDDPHTRQAYIPLFFPEDTGIGDRKPCTLGYQFIMRNDALHVFYPMRSCDFANHFADDVYLAVRLLLWMLDMLRQRDDKWKNVQAGTLTMHITSLHIFINDFYRLSGEA